MQTETLARFAAGLACADIPAEVGRRALDCLIDTVGAATFGASLPWSRIVAGYARQTGAGGRATILGPEGGRVHAPSAALANGALAHAFELDSLRKPGAGVHPGAILAPAALAVGEEAESSGESVIAAFVAGCEVMFRIGAATRHTSETLGFHAPGLTGVFGAAVAAGRLMGLSAGGMAHALGIAASLSSGLLAFAKARSGGMVKRLHLGRAAEGGVLAASLAADGFEGPPGVLEGAFGFLATYSVEPDPGRLTAGLGSEWETRRICLKRYPCHITAHTPIEALAALRAEHGFGAAEIESIVIEASEKVLSHHDIPEPGDLASAQYSVPYSAALSLVRDAADPRAFLAAGPADAEVLALARRIRLAALAEAAKSGKGWASRVTVRLRDGRELTRAADDFPGSPTRPLDRAALERKFRVLAADLGEAESGCLFAALDGLAGRPSLRGLFG
ncbi:MAG: MmgE/PrpD family protein [Proteobacteria bacterium]|nr:MmgE/PrpD family protein [Pseudomonadota bacterium]